MKKIINLALIFLLVVFGSNMCYAKNKPAPIFNKDGSLETLISDASLSTAITNAVPTSAEIPISNISGTRQGSELVLAQPVVVHRILKPANRKVDLHAIFFDPNTAAKEPENTQEMTQMEIAKYKVNEALHGEVSAVAVKGLLEDTMKMTFEKGPIEYMAPWVDYNGTFQNLWTGSNYQNSLMSLMANDVGINGKFRTKDDPASGKKTVFRLMFNTGRVVEGNTYMQSFISDNYIMRYWTKDDQVLAGYARTAVGIEGGESPLTIPFFYRSQISRTYGNMRALGVKMQGNHKYYDYSAGVFSSGRYFKDFFPGPEVVALFSLKPLGFANGKYGNLAIGGSYNAGNAESHYCVTGAHLVYEKNRFKAQAEYATADGSNGSTGFTTNSSEGYYGTLSYRITPRLQALIRYDQFDPDKIKMNDRRTEYTAGLNYFVKGHALKLMLNYTYYTVENGTYGTRIMTGAQIVL